MQSTFIQRLFKRLVHSGLFLRECKIVFGWFGSTLSSIGSLRLEGFPVHS